jgi:sulfate permease, SulP family
MLKLSKFFQNYKIETLSGLTVALALVPEAIAFAFIAGVAPLVGLYAAFIVGLVTSLFGGRKGMISGATGALAVVMVSLVATHGVEYLFATVVLMGILQMLAGYFHLGRFIKMVPYPVMIGFVNGLAIVIFISQLSQFQIIDDNGEKTWMNLQDITKMLAIVGFTMAVIYIFPKITKKFPAALAGILASSLVVIFFNIDTKTVGDLASIAGGLPSFHIPMVDLNLETIKIIFPYALILATIGLIESLLTLTLIDEMTGTKGRNSRECFFQGVANLFTGFFGGMGGCAMIGQSMINIKSGGRGRLSGFSAAIFLLCFIIFAAKIIEMIPIATLVGVMFVVVIATFEWSTFGLFKKIPQSDLLVIVTVSVVTVFTDLAVAVIVGIIMSALVYSWNSAKNTYAENKVNDNKKTYIIHGEVFFASSLNFKDLFSFDDKESEIIIDFKHTRLWDHSALEAVEQVAQNYLSNNKKLHLIHLSPRCVGLLDKAKNCIVKNSQEDPYYRMAVLQRDKFY